MFTNDDILRFLQCAIPVFEELLPEPHNTNLYELLFELATWHDLAKLKMHTESTLYDLDNSLICLDKNFYHFKKITCAVYITCDLPSKIAAHKRRTAALAAVNA